MKQRLLFILVAVGLCATLSTAQDSKYPKIDASVLDYATYPATSAYRNYMTGDDRNQNSKIRVMYSRPKVNDRTIFGELVPYGQEWRLGANEATEIAFYQAVGIGDHVLNGGYYSIFADVNEDSWTLHFSTQRSIWGNANRDKSQDVASIKVPVQKSLAKQEAFGITFREINEHLVHMVIAWDMVKVAVPIEMNPAVIAGEDVSPLDQAVYPAKAAYVNYLEGDEKKLTQKIRVVYARPQKKGRKIFGELLPYGEVWRVGANESTEISLFQDVKIGDQNIPAGRYALYATVHEDKWDFILSRDLPAWGHANRDESKDVATISAPTSKTGEEVEALSIIFTGEGNNPTMVVAWDDTKAELPITIMDKE